MTSKNTSNDDSSDVLKKQFVDHYMKLQEVQQKLRACK